MSDPIPQNRDTTPRTAARTPPPHFTLRSLFIATAIVAMIVAGAKAAQLAGVGIALLSICIATWISAKVTGRRDLSAAFGRLSIYGGFALAAYLLLPSAGSRPTPHRAVCQNNLRNFGQALLAYENQHGSFPPVHTLDENGNPLMSWRSLIMPQLGRYDFHAAYHAEEPWNSPANKRVTRFPLELMKCPSDSELTQNSNLTSYVALISPGGAWISGRGLKLSEIKDDPRDTILLVEMRDSNIPWAEPRDLDLDNLPQSLTPQNFLDSISNHPGIVNVLFADGSVQSIPTTIPWQDFLALLTIAGGETIDRSKW